MSKKKKGTFSKVLKDNAKKIRIAVGEETKSVAEMTEETVGAITASPLDGVIPLSATEAVENSIPGESGLTIMTTYAKVVFTLYEFALKNPANKQALLMQLPASEVENILDGDFGTEYDSLFTHTNLKMILDGMSEKRKNRLTKWSEETVNNPDIYVVKIPNIIFFYNTIKKGETADSRLFDLVLVFVRTKKALHKMKKKEEQFLELSDWVVKNTVSIIRDLGIGSMHVALNDDFFDDVHKFASSWAKNLSTDDNKILNRIVFSTMDPDTLASFQHQVKTDLITAGENGIKVI